MSRPGVLLPVMQRWSCHNCGGCCREHQITITEQEKQQIERQRWSAESGIAADRPLIVAQGPAWRLNHQDDGACVFLDENGLCRIHAKFGEAAKPLACRLYPYAIHPAGHLVTTSLRFSCPSVVQNRGELVTSCRATIESLAAEVVPADYRTSPAPDLRTGQGLAWPDVTRILAFLERGISDSSVPLVTRLIRILSWLELLDRAASATVVGEQLGTLLPLLHEASVRAYPGGVVPEQPPSKLARIMFRQFVAQLLRHDTAVLARRGLSARLSLLVQGLRFTLGLGRIPQVADPESVRVAFVERAGLGKADTSVRFQQLEQPFGGRTADCDDVLERYFRVRIQGLHFCGPAFYGYSLIAGFQSLALMYPAVMWTARLRAARAGRSQLQKSDVEAALATLDHNFGYSPVMGLQTSRQRIRQLAQMQQITTLCAWYSR